jgi:ubiquinone/menaquinone biosynthesis C-methylase UbiE
VVADALNLPFREKSFSTVCVSGVLHHIYNLERALEELCRVSRHFICIDETSTTPPPLIIRLIQLYFQFLFSLRKRIFKKSVIKGWRVYRASEYERPLNPNHLAQLYKKNGFKVVEMRFFNDIPLSYLFLPEIVRKYIFAGLISSKGGTNVEIIAKRVEK